MRHREQGMVTVELAVAIPALVLVLVVTLTAVRAGIDQIRCVDAARVGARAAARGEGADAARQAALREAPTGATVRVDLAGGQARVEVTARAGGVGPTPSWGLAASSVADLEQAGSADAP